MKKDAAFPITLTASAGESCRSCIFPSTLEQRLASESCSLYSPHLESFSHSIITDLLARGSARNDTLNSSVLIEFIFFGFGFSC
jgi:hypothetical protein